MTPIQVARLILETIRGGAAGAGDVNYLIGHYADCYAFTPEMRAELADLVGAMIRPITPQDVQFVREVCSNTVRFAPGSVETSVDDDTGDGIPATEWLD